MKGYTTRDVARLLGLTPRQVREYGRSGVLDADRDERGRYVFSFQDLVLLRTARALMDASVPHRRILRSLRLLKQQLPEDRALTEVRIAAEGDDVVAHDRGRAWEPESGQLVFSFDVADLAARVEPLAQQAVDAGTGQESAAEWLELAMELEVAAPAQARRAYERVLELAPDHLDALVNLGRLLHEDGEVSRAVALYRRALEASGGDDPIAAFNLGIALEDLGREREALEAYRRTVEVDPAFADAHYNLSRMLERTGDRVSALRHLKNYRSLTTGSS